MGQSRIENILENILGANNVIVEPQSRNEYLLIQIMEMLANQDPSEPISEEEIETIVNALE